MKQVSESTITLITNFLQSISPMGNYGESFNFALKKAKTACKAQDWGQVFAFIENSRSRIAEWFPDVWAALVPDFGTGVEVASQPDGSVYARCVWENGVMQSYTLYYGNGGVRMTCEYSGSDKQEVTTEYYRGGEVRKKYYCLNGQMHGRYLEYHTNGQVKMEMQMNEGVPFGLETHYCPHGVIEVQEAWEGGKAKPVTYAYHCGES